MKKGTKTGVLLFDIRATIIMCVNRAIFPHLYSILHHV